MQHTADASTRPQITAVVFVIAVGVGHGINGGIIINRTIIRTEHVIAYFTAFSGFTDFIGTILVGITKVKTEVATVGMINNRVDLCLAIDKNEKMSRTAFLQTRYFGKFCNFIVVGLQIITIRIIANYFACIVCKCGGGIKFPICRTI